MEGILLCIGIKRMLSGKTIISLLKRWQEFTTKNIILALLHLITAAKLLVKSSL